MSGWKDTLLYFYLMVMNYFHHVHRRYTHEYELRYFLFFLHLCYFCFTCMQFRLENDTIFVYWCIILAQFMFVLCPLLCLRNIADFKDMLHIGETRGSIFHVQRDAFLLQDCRLQSDPIGVFVLFVWWFVLFVSYWEEVNAKMKENRKVCT